LWTALGLLRAPTPTLPRLRGMETTMAGTPEALPPPQVEEGWGGGWRRATEGVLVLISLTIVAGGFVAGLNAGLTYNTFPLMDGSFVPAGYAQLSPFIRNWFENVAAVQFDHRVLAMTTVGSVIALCIVGRRAPALSASAKRALNMLLAVALLQLSLGISTLLLVVPIPLAAAHQAGAVLLLTTAIVLRHRLRRPHPLAISDDPN